MEQLEQCNCRLQSDPPLERPSETGRKRLASAPPAIDVTRQAVQTKKARVQQEKPDLENKKKMAFETWVLESLLELKEMMQKGVNKPQEDVSQVEVFMNIFPHSRIIRLMLTIFSHRRMRYNRKSHLQTAFNTPNVK